MLSDEVQEWLITHLGTYGTLMERLGYFKFLQTIGENPEIWMDISSDLRIEELRSMAEETLLLAADYKQVLEQEAPKVLEKLDKNLSELEDICYKIMTP